MYSFDEIMALREHAEFMIRVRPEGKDKEVAKIAAYLIDEKLRERKF